MSIRSNFCEFDKETRKYIKKEIIIGVYFVEIMGLCK